MNVVQPLGAVFISILILVLDARQARYYLCTTVTTIVAGKITAAQHQMIVT